MKIREKFKSIFQKPRRERKIPKPVVSVPYWVKAIAIGQYQDESEGSVVKAGWIKSPQSHIVFDNARGAFLVLLDVARMECEPLPNVWPDKDEVRIEYRPGIATPTGMWPVAKSILILEDGRVFVWPERFHLYKEILQGQIQQAMEFFEDEKWRSAEVECEKVEAGV